MQTNFTIEQLRDPMIKRSNKFIRNQRGTMILAEGDERLVKGFMPNR